MNVCAKFRCAPPSIKKALGIFRELITTTTTKQEQLEWLFGTRLPGQKSSLIMSVVVLQFAVIILLHFIL